MSYIGAGYHLVANTTSVPFPRNALGRHIDLQEADLAPECRPRIMKADGAKASTIIVHLSDVFLLRRTLFC